MTRVQVVSDFLADGIAIRITNSAGEPPARPSLILRIEDGYARWQPYPEDDVSPVGARLTATLPDDVARALLDALTRHYHGAEDARALRKDYDAERGRVDKLTTAVIGLAETLAGD